MTTQATFTSPPRRAMPQFDMGKASLRSWGIGLWCVVSAACAGRVETDSTGTAGAAGSAATGPALLCGVENTERIAGVLCAVTAAWCESVSGCCQAEGFAATAGDCRAQQGPRCIESVRANLEAGACFALDAYSPACDELTLESFSRCSTAGLLSADLLKRSAALGCDDLWIHGNVPDGAPCAPGGSAQCAQGEGERSYCFPNGTSGNVCNVFRSRTLGESCDSLADSCRGGARCNSNGICAMPGDAGAPCVNAFSDCSSGLCQAGVCVELVGTPCAGEFSCGTSGVCGDDGLCRERPLANETRCDFSVGSAAVPE